LATSGLLTACAPVLPPTQVSAQVAPQWQAPLPHQGSVAALSQWWQAQGDALLVELIDAAQVASPTVAQAQARMASMRANLATANAALQPAWTAQAGVSRGVTQPAVPLATTWQGGVQAAWELDVVGASRALSQAAQGQLEASAAQWHDARVAVAAEVASLYASYGQCTQQLALARQEADSWQHTARLTALNAGAGFVAAEAAALASANAATARSRLTSQQATCDVGLKLLVALTALPEPELREKLTVAPVKIAQTAIFSIASVPAQTLSQRPDVIAAEREVVLASAQVGAAMAQRWPRLSLSGSIGALRVGTGGAASQMSTWSLGPLGLSLPIFDGGQAAAGEQAARAHYDATVLAYRAKVRQAVSEVEQALVRLHSAESRRDDAQAALDALVQSLAATQTRVAQGLASGLALEEARRAALAGESAPAGAATGAAPMLD
jgi:NodT family efflux transporter outer membrane factor (OMF) lipoprotein